MQIIWSAVEEWRHLLDLAEPPNTNLVYIRTSNRLNYHQARWALYFNRFSFTLSHGPGSKNIQPDALSHQFQKENPVEMEIISLPVQSEL